MVKIPLRTDKKGQDLSQPETDKKSMKPLKPYHENEWDRRKVHTGQHSHCQEAHHAKEQHESVVCCPVFICDFFQRHAI